MQLKIFVLCRDLTNLIGVNNKLLWHIPSDLKRFKRITSDQFLLFGRKTYESLPNKTLPKRNLLILTNNESYELTDQSKHFHVKILNGKIFTDRCNLANETIYICGGSEIYKIFLTDEDLMPEIIIDSIYQKKYDFFPNGTYLFQDFNKILDSEYIPYFINEIDGIVTKIWIKKTKIIHEIISKILE